MGLCFSRMGYRRYFGLKSWSGHFIEFRAELNE